VLVTKKDGSLSFSKITVRSDPRSPAPDTGAMKQNLKRTGPIVNRIKDLNILYQRYFECSHSISLVENLSSKSEAFAVSVKDFHPRTKGAYDALERRLSGRQAGLFSKINEYMILYTASTALTEDEEKSVSASAEAIEEAITQINSFLSREWPDYLKNLASKQISLDAVLNR